MTLFYKIILPLLLLCGLAGWTLLAVSEHTAGVWYCEAIAAAVAVLAPLKLAPLKKVSVHDNEFRISNFFSTHAVPLAHLIRVEERGKQPPMIILNFHPPTPYGDQVAIVPPFGILSDAPYERALEFLTKVVDANEDSDANGDAGAWNCR